MCGNKMVSPQTIEAAYQLVLADAVKYFLLFLTILRCPLMADLAVYLKKTPMSSSVGWVIFPSQGMPRLPCVSGILILVGVEKQLIEAMFGNNKIVKENLETFYHHVPAKITL